MFQFSLFGINTYLVYDPVTLCCAVIDPGMIHKEEENAISDYILKNNLKLTHIINTHLHIDHVAGDNYLKKKYEAPLLANAGDLFLLKNLQAQAELFGLPIKFDAIEIDQNLEPGEVIKIGKGELKVIGVPGHSKGSITLYDPRDKFLIAGDALFQGSIGRTDLPGGNHSELLKNIKENLFSLPDDTVVYPGHGPSTTIGAEKKFNPFFYE